MTPEQVRKVVSDYDFYLKSSLAVERSLQQHYGGSTLEHLRWMCAETDKFILEGQTEKAMRWLGFIQGTLWTLGYYTIDEMRGHNAPTVEEQD